MNIKEIINIEETISTKFFKNITYPWEVLYNLENKIIELGKELDKIHYKEIEKNIWIGKNVIIDKYSVEIFANDGEQVMTSTFYTPLDAQDITLSSKGKSILSIEKHKIDI